MLESHEKIMKKQHSNQIWKVEKMVVLAKTFNHYYHKFQLFQLSCQIVKNLKLKLRSKFNYDFTNHDYLHSGLQSCIQF